MADQPNWLSWSPEGGGGWLGCPHCKPELCQIYLPRAVRGEWPFIDTVAEAGLYIADFNRQGAARVNASNVRQLGFKPEEFEWTQTVPPNDRWCKGAGGVHKEVRRG